MYGLSFFWTFVIDACRLLASGTFDLFLLALGVAVIWRARGLVALKGLRWVGGGIVFYGLTDLLAHTTWFFTGLFDLYYKAGTVLGVGPVELFNLGLDATGLLVDAACLAMVVFGAVSVARRLATPANEAA